MQVKDQIMPLDVVMLTIDVPKHDLHRGESRAMVERYADGAYDMGVYAPSWPRKARRLA
jgi:hypothetical protein